MDLGASVFAVGVILYIGFEVGVLGLVFKGLQEKKAETGRFSVPWSDVPPIRKGLLVALPLTLVGFFIWLYYYSIFAPEPGEFYNLEIVTIGLFFSLALIANFWLMRN